MHFFEKYNSLFSRLLLSFFLVLLIPVILLSLYFIALKNNTTVDAIKRQGEISASHTAKNIEEAIESYRHKAYQLSINPLVIETLKNNIPIETAKNMRPLYEVLYTIMKGDIDFASALIVSNNGNARYSTHLFPSNYDLRVNQNDENPFFDFSRAQDDTISFISLENRYITENNALVTMSIFRRVQAENDNNLGYVSVDIFQNVFSPLVNKDLLFEEVILIDTKRFIAASLLHSAKFGSFAEFPYLENIQLKNVLHSSFQKNIIQVSVPIKGTPFLVVGIINNKHYMNYASHLLYIPLLIILGSLVAAGIAAYILSRVIVHPVNLLVTSMKQFCLPTTKLSTKPQRKEIYEMALLNSAFNVMGEQIQNLLTAERKALEAQLHPHFLYNTLNTIKSIAALHNENEIVSITTNLAHLLRSTISNTHTEVPLEDSIKLVQSYLSIQKIRFGEKLQCHIEVDPLLLQAYTPKFILQPLIENALIHGLEPKTGDWYLSLHITSENGNMIIKICDNGIGIKHGTIPDKLSLLQKSDHVGIYNIYRRLELRYANSFSLNIDSNGKEGTCVTLILPIHFTRMGDESPQQQEA